MAVGFVRDHTGTLGCQRGVNGVHPPAEGRGGCALLNPRLDNTVVREYNLSDPTTWEGGTSWHR